VETGGGGGNLVEVDTGGGYGCSDFLRVVPSPRAAAGGRVPARDKTAVVGPALLEHREPRCPGSGWEGNGERRASPELRGGARVQGSGEENQEM
jgi:hypothetical protein